MNGGNKLTGQVASGDLPAGAGSDGDARSLTVLQRMGKLPIVGPIGVAIARRYRKYRFPGSIDFWRANYASGGYSGPGSRGRLADYKASFVNAFLTAESVQSVVEFGCGDGYQVSLISYPKYVGLDVSSDAIKLCIARFAGDSTKSFMAYDPNAMFDGAGILRQDVSLSLDVIFHLVEDQMFETYMRLLFRSAERYVVIYSSSQLGEEHAELVVPEVRHRDLVAWVENAISGWRLKYTEDNPYPYSGDITGGTFSRFFVYEKV